MRCYAILCDLGGRQRIADVQFPEMDHPSSITLVEFVTPDHLEGFLASSRGGGTTCLILTPKPATMSSVSIPGFDLSFGIAQLLGILGITYGAVKYLEAKRSPVCALVDITIVV